MSPKDDLVPMLKKLRLSGVLQSLDLRTKQAVEDNLALSEFLYRLLADEVERRILCMSCFASRRSTSSASSR